MTEIIVVPLERHVERAMESGARAIAWPRLVDALAQRWLEGRKLAGPEHTRLALADAVAAFDHPPMVRARALGALSWEHMLDALDDAILELRRADVDSALLREVSRGRSVVVGRATLLADALDALDARLAKSGFVDGRALEGTLARVLADASASDLVRAIGAETLRVRSFVGFDAATARVLRVLARALEPIGGGVRVELPSFASPLDALRERDPLEITIDRAGALLGEPPETYLVARRLGDFTGDAPPEDPSRVQIAVCESAEAQARAAVLSVMRALADGVPVERIAVATPTGDEETLAPLRRLFDEAGVPMYDARGPAPARAGIVAFALEALTVGPRGLPRRDVARILRSTYVDGRRLSETRGTLAAIASALENHPTTPQTTARATLRRVAEVGLRDDDARTERLVVVDRVSEVLEATTGARTRAAHVAAARALFDALGLRVRAVGLARRVLTTDEAPRGVARAELRALAADSHAWEVLQGALARYETAANELDLGAPCVPEVFEHELRRALEAGPALPGGGRAFAVRVGRLSEVAFEELDHVVVLDANDGALPRLDAEEGLVSSELAAALRERDVRRAPFGEGERAAAQLASLAVLVDRASSVLVAHRTEDASGAALAPASFVLWLERAGVPVTRANDAPLSIRPVSPREHELLLLALAPEYAVRSPAVERRAERETLREKWHDRIDADPSAVAPEEVGSLIGPEVALALEQETGGGARPLSVTALERIANCPFQGFASVVLRAGEELLPEDRPDAREEGTMVHEALRVVFEGTRELLRARPRDAVAIRERAGALLAEHFRAETAPLRDLAVARLREEVLRVLDVAVADVEWDFDGAEVAFGVEAPGAFSVVDGATRVALRGTVDRVDVGRERAAVRVIDYKRAVNADVRRDELGVTRLQIPVYAAEMRAVHGVPAAEGAYVPTQTPEASPRPDLRERLDELLADDGAELRRSIARRVASLRGGAIAPRPTFAVSCDKCDLDGGCRRPRFVSGADEPASEEP